MMPAEFRFLDGPLMVRRRPANTNDLVEAMAKDLVEFEAFAVVEDAQRCLMARGFSPFEVMARVRDAMAVATQSVVAEEMSDR